MKTQIAIATIAMLSGLAQLPALAAPAGRVLFTQPGTEIVDANGVKRAAKQGDVLESGERLLTPRGAISQILLPDGSLVGMRPGSDVKLELPAQASDKAGQLVSLLEGSLRVIGSELMDVKKPSALTVQTGLATLRLTGADLESAIVKPTDAKTPGAGDAGSYNRLLTGAGSIGNGTMVEPLAVRQVSFVGVVNMAPVTLASVSPTLFASNVPVAATPGVPSTRLVPQSQGPTVPALPGSGGSPLTTNLPTTTPPTSLPTTRLPTYLPAPTVVAIAPPTFIYVAPIVTKTPVTITTLIKTCTNTIVRGIKVCI